MYKGRGSNVKNIYKAEGKVSCCKQVKNMGIKRFSNLSGDLLGHSKG